MLARQAAAAVGVRTWKTAATLQSARQRKALRRPRGGEERGAGDTVAAARLQLVNVADAMLTGTQWMNWTMVGAVAVCIPVLLQHRYRYRRLDIDIPVLEPDFDS